MLVDLLSKERVGVVPTIGMMNMMHEGKVIAVKAWYFQAVFLGVRLCFGEWFFSIEMYIRDLVSLVRQKIIHLSCIESEAYLLYVEEGEGNFRLPQFTTKQPDQRDYLNRNGLSFARVLNKYDTWNYKLNIPRLIEPRTEPAGGTPSVYLRRVLA